MDNKEKASLHRTVRSIVERIDNEDREMATKVKFSFADIMFRVNMKGAEDSRFYRRFAWVASAAAVIAGALLMISLFYGTGGGIDEEALMASWTKVVAPKGEHVNLILPDGSEIHINSGSEVSFPQVYDPEKREVRVSGEAFLDVAKDEGRPFYVRTEDFDVRVYGTSFNVSAYPEDESGSVVLAEGKVEVSSGGQNCIILPGQKAEVNDGRLTVSDVDIVEYTGWKDKILVMNGHTMPYVLGKLQRYYGVEIIYDAGVGPADINGKLDLEGDLTTVLDNLCILLDLEHRKLSADSYIIRPKK